jgi:hypothetical protein
MRQPTIASIKILGAIILDGTFVPIVKITRVI